MAAKPTSKPGARRKVSKVSENHESKVSGPVKKTIKEANPVGRPTLYREVYAEQAYRFCLLGATDEELADFLHIAVSTLNNWKIDYPDFMESINKGKLEADSKVAESLYKRATGYSHPDTHVSNYQGEITLTEITKHYPPDTAAAFIWLKNRQPSKWKDKVEVKEDINLNIFPPKEVLDGIYEKALSEAAKRREMLAERRLRINALIARESDGLAD